MLGVGSSWQRASSMREGMKSAGSFAKLLFQSQIKTLDPAIVF